MNGNIRPSARRIRKADSETAPGMKNKTPTAITKYTLAADGYTTNNTPMMSEKMPLTHALFNLFVIRYKSLVIYTQSSFRRLTPEQTSGRGRDACLTG